MEFHDDPPPAPRFELLDAEQEALVHARVV